jgi:class 3 adenylate cyclase
MSNIRKFIAIRDHIKKKSNWIFIEQLHIFKQHLEKNEWELASIFQLLFSDVAPVKIDISNQPGNGELDSVLTEKSWREWNQHEFGKAISLIASESGLLFVNCNYFLKRPLADGDPRLFAPNLVLEQSTITELEVKGGAAFRFLQAMRSGFQERGLLPIVDFITNAAPVKRAFAIELLEGEGPEGQLFEWIPEGSAKRETVAPSLRVWFKNAFADFLEGVYQFIGPVNGERDQSNHSEVADSIDGMADRLRAYVSGWAGLPTNQEKVNKALGGLASILNDWYRIQDTVGREKSSLLNIAKRKGKGLPEDVCGMDAFAIVMSLVPLERILGVKCHYSFPCHISYPDTSRGGTSCAVLTVGTKSPINLAGRKILSDLSCRVMLIPLSEQLVLEQEKDAKFMEGVASQVAELVWPDFKNHKEELLETGLSGQGAFVFTDISGYSKFTKTLVEHFPAPDPSPHVLKLLRIIWKKVAYQVRYHGGAMGKHAGDGVFFFFPGVSPFSENYKVGHSLRAFCMLSHLSKLFPAAINEWLTDKHVKKYLAELDSQPFVAIAEFKEAVYLGNKVQENSALVKWLVTEGLALHTGFHIGKATYGNAAAGFNYTAIGHDVNDAARLQEIAGRGEIALFYKVWDELKQSLERLRPPRDQREALVKSPSEPTTFGRRYKTKNRAVIPGKFSHLKDEPTCLIRNEYFRQRKIDTLLRGIHETFEIVVQS